MAQQALGSGIPEFRLGINLFTESSDPQDCSLLGDGKWNGIHS